MNATPKPPGRLPIPLLVRFLVILLVPALLLYGITGFFRLSAEARSLRNGLTRSLQSQSVDSRERIELRIGAITCYLLRVGLSFAPVPEEAQLALRAVRGAEVGLYQLGAGAGTLTPGEVLSAADTAMAQRGWDRVVGVAAREGELVAVYMPEHSSDAQALRLCVAVLNRDHLIVAGGRGNLEPLLELASRQGRLHRPELGAHLRRGTAPAELCSLVEF